MANSKSTRVVTGTVRLSYCSLLKPRSKQGQEPRYSTTLLIPKNDIATMQRLYAAIEAAAQDGAASKWGGRPPKFDTPIHDGDGARPSDGQPFGPECKGHWVLAASSKRQPEIVDANLSPIINETAVYSGMFARVSVDFFPYFQQGKKGVGCGLGNVQKIQDGEALGSHSFAADDFGDGQEAAPAGPAYGQYGAPTQQPYQPAQYNAPAQQSYQPAQYNAPTQQPYQPTQYSTPAQQPYQPIQYGAPAQQPYQPALAQYGTPAQQPYQPAQPQYTPSTQQAPYGAANPLAGQQPYPGVNPLTGQPLGGYGA